MQESDVLDLLLQTAGFATAGKTAETCATSAKGPAGDGYLEIDELLQDRLCVGFVCSDEIQLSLVFF